MPTADYYIRHLHLSAHPEGGYYKETYRSQGSVVFRGFDGERNISTSIYFLLREKEISHLHRIKSDEQWFFHDGAALEIVVLHKGILTIYVLGKDQSKGESLHVCVPAGAWFGARLKDQKGFCLVSCTVAPGFDFADFELAEYKKISREFPAYMNELERMCIK